MKIYNSYGDTVNAIKSKETTCYKIVQRYLKNISEKNPEINAFVEVFSEEALHKAREIDQKILDGNEGKLAGMVIGIKDNICIKNHRVTASSKILKGFKWVRIYFSR